jgi:hypothetical protein
MPAFDIDAIIADFKGQQAKAQAAQAKQMKNLIQTIKDLGTQTGSTFDDALGKIEGLGETARERTKRTGQRTLAAGQQDLISSGFAQSTLAPNLRRAVAEDTEFAQQGIDEQVGLQQSNLLTQRAANERQIGLAGANAIGSQNIQGPDLGFFANLLQQAAAAGDPNQKTTAFAGVNTAALNAPNSAFQRSGSSGSASPSTGFGVKVAGTPSGVATTQGNVKATQQAAATGGSQSISASGKKLGGTTGSSNNGCPPGTRLFPNIGCF